MKPIKWLAAAAIACSTLLPLSAHATKLPSPSDDGILIEPILPHEQVASTDAYIHIDTVKTEHTFKYKLHNRTDKAARIQMAPTNAYTNQNGSIEYTNKKPLYAAISDDAYRFQSYVDMPKEIILKPHKKATVPVNVDTKTLPQGTLLGGVRFHIEPAGKQKEAKKDALQNEVHHIKGIQIDHRQTVPHQPIVKVGDATLMTMPSYYVIMLDMHNASPAIVNTGTVKYTVSKDKKILFKGNTAIKMAPMTKTQLAIPYASDTLESGAYTIKGVWTVKNDQNNVTEKLAFERDFTVDNDNLDAMGDTPKKPSTPNDTYTVYLIIAAALLFALILFFIRYYRRKKKQENDAQPTEHMNEEE